MYTNLILFSSVIIGILVHSLVEIDKINHDPNKKNFNIKTYIGTEWASMLICLLIGIVAIFAKSEIKQLEMAGKWLILGYFAIGFMGQSLLASFIGKAQKMIN